MTSLEPLTEEEELLWRALMRLTVTVPRVLGENLERSAGITGTDYEVMMHLSEAPGRRLRMSDLADRMAFSAGRITRIIAEMVVANRVRRVPCPEDGRSTLAELTDAGFDEVVRAYPKLLETVRRDVFDHLSEYETRRVGVILARLVEVVDADRQTRSRRR